MPSVARELHRRLGQNVRAIRHAQGLTLEKFGELIGFHPTYIGGIERAERNPTLTTIESLADRLGVNGFALLSEHDTDTAAGSGVSRT